MKFAAIEFKFDVKTLFNTNLHLDWSILIWLRAKVCNYELFLLGDSVVVTVYDNVDVIAKSNHDSIVALKLLFNPVELEIVLDAICKRARWFQISHNLKES